MDSQIKVTAIRIGKTHTHKRETNKNAKPKKCTQKTKQIVY